MHAKKANTGRQFSLSAAADEGLAFFEIGKNFPPATAL
jgi:hypothetical protein